MMKLFKIVELKYQIKKLKVSTTNPGSPPGFLVFDNISRGGGILVV